MKRNTGSGALALVERRTMGDRRAFPRRVCAHCQQQRVKGAEDLFCSMDCAKAARRKPRPLCPVCREQPIKKPWIDKTCSRSCGAKLRPPATAFGVKGAAGRKAAYARRVAAFLREELAPMAVFVPMEKLLPVAIRIYQRGRHVGAKATYDRLVLGPRRRSA